MNDDEGILRRIDAARLNRRGRSKSEECSDCDGRRRPAADGGYGLVDLFASYAYNDRASANFSVNNLLNKEYTQFLNIEPNPGSTVKAGLTIKYAEK
jgi:hemoglobin/transferrin/lactoferrin receptor protein